MSLSTLDLSVLDEYGQSRLSLDAPAAEALAGWAIQAWSQARAGGPIAPPPGPVTLPEGTGPIHVAAWAAGELVGEAWSDHAREPAHPWACALAALAAVVPVPEPAIETLVFCSTCRWTPIDLTDAATRKTVFANANRGLVGLALRYAAHELRHPPTLTIAKNTTLAKVVERFRQRHKLTERELGTGAVEIQTFTGPQVAIALDGATAGQAGQAPAVVLYRGSPLVRVEALDRARIVAFEHELGEFMRRAVHPDGRMTYLYYPSLGREDKARNNQIRQWMATVCLIRTAHFRGDRDLDRLAELNVRYNLRTFYSASGKLGLIHEGPKVKLGAVALAAIALMESSKAKQFARQCQRLLATIDYLAQPDGAFRTFFKPADRNDVQNFYPGEAQLAWAIAYEQGRDPALLEKFMRAMRYYRDWHYAQPNPAFVPWHTQACYKVWRLTREPELVEFIFRMSDWLLSMQQWDPAGLPPDVLGRFHDPKRPEYGPPHASSTGVYLEGLIDAFALARELGDAERRERYRRVIVRGLRDAIQLSYRGPLDAHYVKERAWIQGGLRTTVYDNIVRIDNVQHNLMGVLKILATFDEADFRHALGSAGAG